MLNALTFIHVALSLIGIGAGFVVVLGLLVSKPPYRGTELFLTSTAATGVTGFFFPIHGFSPAQVVGVLSLILVLIATLGVYRHHLADGWRRTFAITSVIALYFNVFILVIQMFRKVPALQAVAPTQSEPPFQVAQSLVMLLFVAIGISATKRTRVVASN